MFLQCYRFKSFNFKLVTMAQDGKKSTGHWSQGLITAMQDPKSVVTVTEDVVVITDKFPKAKYHYLVLSKSDITGIQKLEKEHIKVLENIENAGRAVAARHKNVEFKMGYHAVPSMQRLHMHVISTDMISPCLKTKKHWNSFTTDFFVESSRLIEELKANGCITRKSAATFKSLMDTPLRCHICKAPAKNIPSLKRHIESHDNSIL